MLVTPPSPPSRGDLASDIRYAWRGLQRSPGFALAAVLTLAVGIGANATMFSVLDRLLLRPPAHVRAPGELTTVALHRQGNGRTFRQTALSYVMYTALRERGQFNGVAAFAFPVSASLGRGTDARAIRLQLVTGGYFNTLGTRPQLGRLLVDDDDRLPDGQRVVVLGHRFWQDQLGGDPSVVGRNVTIGSHSFEVVGVAPRDFVGTGLGAIDVWMPIAGAGPLRFARTATWSTADEFVWLRVIARLPAGSDSGRHAQLAALAARERAGDGPAVTRAELLPVLRRLGSAAQSPNVRISRLLLAVTGFVLLIACGNLVNLLLARAVRRRRELAIRVALGADRVRLVRLLLLESLMLSLGGAIGALFFARWGGDIIRSQLLAGVSGWDDSILDPRVLVFTIVVATVAALLTGLVPAWRASRPALSSFLRAGAREGGGQQAALRGGLLISQASLTVVLLFGTGLLLRSLDNVHRIDLGFDSGVVMFVDADLTAAGFAPAEIVRITSALAERAEALPGVASSTVALGVPFRSMFGTYLRIPGLDSLPRSGDSGPSFEAVDAAYFSTLGLQITSGRAFTQAEVGAHARVAVVNEEMARRAWPGRDAIGQCLIVGADSMPCSTVIGVVGNAHRIALMEEATPMSFYVPVGTEDVSQQASRSVLIRVHDGGMGQRESIRRQLQATVPGLPHVGLQPLRDMLSGEYRPWEMGATLFAVFGAIALLIAAMGWYASLAYDVNQRRRELGVRLALGALPSGLVRFVVERGLRYVAAGIVVGAVLAASGLRWIREFLYGVAPSDPFVIGVVVGVMVVTSVAATLIPAWRAAKTDPAEALRGEA